MVIYTSAKYASSIIDMTVTNVVNIPIVANVRNIKCEIAEKFSEGLILNNRSVGYEPAGITLSSG